MRSCRSKNQEKVNNCRARLLETEHSQMHQRLLKNQGRQGMITDNEIWQGRDDFKLKWNMIKIAGAIVILYSGTNYVLFPTTKHQAVDSPLLPVHKRYMLYQNRTI